jgi:hypothetical protein
MVRKLGRNSKAGGACQSLSSDMAAVIGSSRDGMALILDRPFFQVSQTAYSGYEVQA